MPAKELGKSSNYWDKRRLLKYTESEKRSKKYINDIRSIYNKANEDIDKMLEDVYRNYAKDTGIDVQTLKSLLTKSETKKTWKELEKQGLDKYIKANYKSRITRLEQIKAQVYAKAKSVYKAEELKQTELYKSVINDSYYKAIYNTQMGTGLNFAFSRIDGNMMNSLLSNRWSGVNYSKRIWTNTDILADEVSRIVGGSLLSGKGVELTAREIRDRFRVSKYYSERLVRTEMNYYDNQADAMAYEEMGIEEFVPVAVLDNRTSQYCADIDGKHFKYSEMEVGVNYPPFHPNCRCTTRGYLGKEAEKLLTRRARNPITGQNEVISNMPYNDWFRGINTLKNSPQSGIINIHIDEFTNCLKRTSDGELIDTYFRKMKTENLSELNDWLFKWDKQKNVYGLYTKDNDKLQGLVSYYVDKDNKAYHINLVESAPNNRKNKEYSGVGGHLFAEVCRRSKQQGYGGFTYFDAKTNLVDYYKKMLNAKLVGNTRRMIIDEESAEELIKKYYGKRTN